MTKVWSYTFLNLKKGILVMAKVKHTVAQAVKITVQAEHECSTKEATAKKLLAKQKEAFKGKIETLRSTQVKAVHTLLEEMYNQYGADMWRYLLPKNDNLRLGGDAFYDGIRASYLAGFPPAWAKSAGNSKHKFYKQYRKTVSNFPKWLDKKCDAARTYCNKVERGLDPTKREDSEENRAIKNARAPIDIATQQANNLLRALQKLEPQDMPEDMSLLSLLDTLRGALQDNGIKLSPEALGEPTH
jgi:hypothetical protein